MAFELRPEKRRQYNGCWARGPKSADSTMVSRIVVSRIVVSRIVVSRIVVSCIVVSRIMVQLAPFGPHWPVARSLGPLCPRWRPV